MGKVSGELLTSNFDVVSAFSTISIVSCSLTNTGQDHQESLQALQTQNQHRQTIDRIELLAQPVPDPISALSLSDLAELAQIMKTYLLDH